MQPKLIYITIFAFLLAFSCTSSIDNTETVEKEVVDSLSFEEIEKDLQEEQQAEIYKIEKKAVIFFMIDRQEAKKLSKELGDSYKWETDMLFNGFLNQTKEFTKLIRKHNIKSDLIRSPKFQIILDDGSSVYFDRDKEDQIMGEILTNGKKEPLIQYGMYKNKELAELIQRFFEIENLGYVSPDTIADPPKIQIASDSSIIIQSELENFE